MIYLEMQKINSAKSEFYINRCYQILNAKLQIQFALSPKKKTKLNMFDILHFKNQEFEDSSINHESIRQLIFPRQLGETNTITQQHFQKYYNHEYHQNELSNLCYRCHDYKTIQVYEQFMQAKEISLKQPQVSIFFPNQYFLNLKEISIWIKNGQKIKDYPGHYISPLPDSLKKILNNIFLQYGYIPNFERLLLFYPTYLQKQLKLQKLLFQNPQIDSTTGYFIGFCASAQLGSVYVMNRMIRKFKESGGDLQWILNKQYPAKLNDILLLSRKMGRCLWQIQHQFIQVILQNGGWSVIQFMLICQIIAFSQQMSTICLGMGLKCEQKQAFPQLKAINEKLTNINGIKIPTIEKGQKLNKVLSSIKQLQVQLQKTSSIKNLNQSMKRIMKRSSRRLQSEQYIQGYMKEIAKSLSNQQIYKFIHQQLQPLLPAFEVIDKRDQHLYSRCDYSEYNFKFNAFPVLNNIVPSSSNAFLDLVRYGSDMTLSNFGKQKVENGTNNFRKGMCYYSQNLCGFTHLQYDYKNNLKKYLTMPFKFQVRLLTYSPVHITKQVIDELNHDQSQIGCLDNGHTSILIANIKMTLALMMVIKAYEQIQN